jgi:hypothetical protein
VSAYKCSNLSSRSSEFANAVELVLEGTIFNLLQEANMSEYDICKSVPLGSLQGEDTEKLAN